jgi:hypothetical protein
MKMKLAIAAFCMMVYSMATAQDFKVAQSTGRLEIVDVNEVTIEGHAGNEIIFSSRDHDHGDDERAKGLRAVSSMGLEDNTGLGLSVINKGDVIEVRQLKKMDGPDITIKVPKDVVISYRHSSPHGGGFSIKNAENKLDISTVHSEVSLENVTGPMSVKTVHGEINVSLGALLKSPISIASVHGHVDIALPLATKASLSLSTSWGEIFVDPEFKIEMDKKAGMVEYSDDFTGKINGGGIEIDLSSTHNNVYLRKK